LLIVTAVIYVFLGTLRAVIIPESPCRCPGGAFFLMMALDTRSIF